jgi:hypothetical protein
VHSIDVSHQSTLRKVKPSEMSCVRNVVSPLNVIPVGRGAHRGAF